MLKLLQQFLFKLWREIKIDFVESCLFVNVLIFSMYLLVFLQISQLLRKKVGTISKNYFPMEPGLSCLLSETFFEGTDPSKFSTVNCKNHTQKQKVDPIIQFTFAYRCNNFL